MNSPTRHGLGIALIGALALSGCANSGQGPYAPQSEGPRNPLEAQRLTLKATQGLDGADPQLLAEAEGYLKEALTADLYHGPAHNNLGVVYLKQGKLYEAAGEFEWARKLMPGLPDPRTNLAMTLERAGRTDEALAAYQTALDVYPAHLESMQGMARLQIRAGKTDDQTPRLLREIAMRGSSERWREWARGQLSRLSVR